ncbi:MAG: ABC transporter ATP-binding protein [Candidatus Aquirickettsiella gammari]
MNSLLQINNLHAYYGQSHILCGVNFDLKEGEVVALLGRNGAGRSTCLKAMMGMVRTEGEIHFLGKTISGDPPFTIAQAGIAYVPEDREIFANLTVEQNLQLGIKPGIRLGKTKWQLNDVYGLFPILKERRHTQAGVLSGGEQQMLALARSLLGNPDLLLVDEPTEGLAPQIIKQLFDVFQTIKQSGVAILLVEQKLNLALQLADRFLILGHGQIVFDGSRTDLQNNVQLRKEWLEV